MFFLLHDFDKSIWLNIRAVAQKQRQVLVQLKKVSLAQNEIYHANKFSGVLLLDEF